MSIKPSPEVNAMIFILTGERLIDADEDLAYESRRPYSGLGRKIDRMSSLIDKSIHDIAEVMPDDLSKSYARAMGMLIDDGGKNYLREFAEQLDKIAEGRRKTSMDIMESKWQVIAEVIRLLIEIAIYLAMSFFTGGASASQIMMAKLRSRFMILTTLTHLLQRLHLAPSLTEAFAEAFTTLAVRLAMMNFAPQGRRPDGIDWGDVGKSAAFGAAAGVLTSIFDDFAKRLVKGYDNNFLKNGPDLDFKKNPNLPDIPDPEFKNKGPGPRPDPDPTPNPNGPDHRPGPTPHGNGPTPGNNTPITFRNNPLSFRNNPDLWRNNRLLRNNADRPGALAGHYGLQGTADFLAAGAGEALAEILIKGAFDGDWSTSWSTFVGAGLSSQVEAGLTGTAKNTGAELRHAIDKLRNQPPPTVSAGGDGTDRSRSSDAPGADSTGHPDATGGANSPAPLPLGEQATGPGDGIGGQTPPPYTAGNPPPYTSPAPPPYSPGTLPVTAAENQLWQQVHHGPGEVREQALRDLAALRGSQQPLGSTEIGVRDSLNGNLSRLPEVRVVPAGGSPAAQVDADQVRRTLDGLGAPVTVGAPPLGQGSGNSSMATADRLTGNTVDPARSVGVDGAVPETASVRGSGDSVVGVSGSAVVEASGRAIVDASGSAVVDSSGEAVGQDGRTTVAPDQAVDGPVASAAPNAVAPAPGTSANTAPNSSTTPHTGTGGRLGSAPAVTGAPNSSATPSQGTPAPDSTVPDNTAPVDDSAQGRQPEQTPETIDSSSGDDVTSTTSTYADTAAVPPRVSTTGSYTDTATNAGVSDVKAEPVASADTAPLDAPRSRHTPETIDSSGADVISPPSSSTSTDPGAGEVKAGPLPTGNPATTQAPPLTIVVSEVPPPGESSPEAAELLDGAGTDRAVVLGPPVAPDGTNRPVRAAVELTREGPGAPVRVRPLTGPLPAPIPDGTTDSRTTGNTRTTSDTTATADSAFPGADVLLPLADALGPARDSVPAPRPATESTVKTVGSLDVTAPVKPEVLRTGPTSLVPAVSGDGTLPEPKSTIPTANTAESAGAKLETLSRPWTATELHLESGRSDQSDRSGHVGRDGDSDGTGGHASGPGAGRGTGNGGTPPPPTTPDNPPATPVAAPPPPPTGRIVARPANTGGTVDGNGPARTGDVPVVTTLDGLTVPVAQLRRLVPYTAVTPQPGSAVRTLTISQGPAEDGTAQSAGRQALLGQDTFRGVRTTSDVPTPAKAPAPEPAPAPSTPRTVFTGPPVPLPGADTKQGADYFVGHGTPRTVTLGTDDPAHPTVTVSGVQLGRALSTWADGGDRTRPLVLFSCETGRQPRIAGLPVAQHVANRTGRPAYAPTTEVGTARDGNGDVRAVLTEGADGPGRWRLFTPEPSGADLDRLARGAGLHAGPEPADAFTRARTLQQVRTLREILGPDAERSPENREPLAGLAHVDGLRWLTPDAAARYGDGRMTADLLDRMVTDWHTATGGPAVDPTTGPTRGQYTAFLRAAADLRATAGPDATLDALLPPPPPELPPTTLVSQEDVRGLSVPPPVQVAWSLSGDPLPLSELGLGPEDTAELTRRLLGPAPTVTVSQEPASQEPASQEPASHEPAPQEPASPRPGGSQEADTSTRPRSGSVDTVTARDKYGFPEKNYKGFRDLVRERNLVLDVRPTNPGAAKWLDAGAMAKPAGIKAKSISDVDVHLGAQADDIGLVGYFRPTLPERGSLTDEQWDKIMSRYNERSTEFRELALTMAAYERDNTFVVRDGVIHGVDQDGTQRPVTSDHDVFDVSTPGGTRVPSWQHDALIEEMGTRDMAVVHGAHMFWVPSTEFDKSVFDKVVSSHRGPDGEPLLRFRPENNHAELTWPAPPTVPPAPASVPGRPQDPADHVRADGRSFLRVQARADGNTLFRAVLDSARGRAVPPAWAARNIAGLRALVRDRVIGSELGAVADDLTPDPVFTVLDDLRMRALAGVDDPAEQRRITEEWNRTAQQLVTDGDAGRWRQILADSGYPRLVEVAPTPADARRLGGRGLLAAVAERPELWPSPFADLLPEALAHTLDIGLRVVQPDRQGTDAPVVTQLNPGGSHGTLHLAWNGSDHFDALVPAPAPAPAHGPVPPTPTTTSAPTEPPASREPDGTDPFGEWLRGMGGITDLDSTPAADQGDRAQLETQLDRYRPARLLRGEDARPPGPAPRTVTFEDGSRLPAVLIRPGADPRDTAPDGTDSADGMPQGRPTGLLPGPGALTLRSPELVAQEILDQLPTVVRRRFDESELLRLLTDQPAAFTAPRGARIVGRERSGVGLEMTVEAIPYHRWERFSDVGNSVKIDTTRRGQAATGGGRSVGFGRRIAGALSMGPPFSWLLKINASLGWTRRTDYSQGTTALHQSEARGTDGSHLHLDDVHYRVRVERVTEAPRSTGRIGSVPRPDADGTGTPPPGSRWVRTPVHSAEFGMRDGLSWRLPDDLTVPFEGPRRAPETLTFPDGTVPRLSDSAGLYLVDPPEDVAMAVSGARPGSSAHRILISFARPDRLLGMFGRLTGPVSGPELTRGSGQHPMGHLVVERSVPHRAVLVTESVKTEVRDLAQTTYSNQRGHVRETRFGLQITSGPNYQFVGPLTDVRVQGGPLVRTDLAAGRGHYLGTDAVRKVAGRVRDQPMALYQVERTLMVRRAGEPPSAARPVRVVSLDWISTQDARRLAGWDSRTPGRTGPNPDAEPPVPWYLTREDPVHLGGQVRAEGFRPQPRAQVLPTIFEQAEEQDAPPAARPDGTPAHVRDESPDGIAPDDTRDPDGIAPDDTRGMPDTRVAPRDDATVQDTQDTQDDQAVPQDPVRVFADAVLDTLHRSYPTLFVPPLMVRHPRLARLWYGDTRLRTALHNDRQVREALNRPTLTQSLDELTTTGIPVTLTEDGKVRRGHHTLTLRARLTDRRFEAPLSERSMRNSVVGNEISGQSQQQASTYTAGVEVGVSPRDHDKVPGPDAPARTGNTMVGARYARGYQDATRNTITVAHDHLAFQTGVDLYSYRVDLSATFEGHRRPRGWARLLSVGLLGTGVFVSKVEERPLFSGGTETVGRVELAVPTAHGSDRYAPTDPPADATSPSPAPRRLSAREAEQLLDGTRPLPRTGPDAQRLVKRLLSAPHVVLSTEGGPQRQQLMQDTADRASGGTWHVSAPGAPVRTALRRAVANLSVAGQLGQYLGPFGSRITGLNGAGALRTHYLKAAVRGELDNVRVRSEPKPSSMESSLGNEHKVVGSDTTTSRTVLGLQGGYMPLQQVSGTEALVGSYSTALQYAWGKARGVTQSIARGRNTTLTFAGRMYLVVADAAETVAVGDRWTAALGTVGTRAGERVGSAAGRLSERLGRGLSPRRAAAAVQRISEAVMFHLPMQDAIEAGLAPDGLGTATPRNLGGGYRVPDFLRGRRFPTRPGGQLDASGAAPDLMRRLARMGVPSHDREQVLQRLSPDFLRAHLHELTTDGMSLPVRYRTWSRPQHLPVGGSPGQVRFKLTPVSTTVQRLRTGYELSDSRGTARENAGSATRDRGGDVTLSAGMRSTGSGPFLANPSLQGTAARQPSSGWTETEGSSDTPGMGTTQAHAEVVTAYVLTVTMTDAVGDALPPRAVTQVGTLNEIVSAGLLTPVGDGDDGTLTEQDVPEPEREVRMLTAGQARPDAVAAWRGAGDGAGGPDPDILPFDDRIGSGVVAVDVRGAANVQDALTLATARADGLGDGDLGTRHTGEGLTRRVRMARLSPLTGLGTAPAQAQQEATSQGGLTAGFREALGADGSALPTQTSARLFGQTHTADSRIYAKMRRRGARLLAVESKPSMSSAPKPKSSAAHETGIPDNVEGAVATAPILTVGNAGVAVPGFPVPVGGADNATALKGAPDSGVGAAVKATAGRGMLFSVPVTWLAVTEANHRITDSRPLYALGKAQRGPRAAEAETTVLVWLSEDVAREYGLLDDTTFPDEVATAWDDMAKAANDLAAAEKEYYGARARARETWLSLTSQEQAALGDDDPSRATVLPRDVAESPAVVAWQAARDAVRLWEGRVDTAAADHHRLHLAASRLTAHHQGSAAVPVRDVPREYAEPDWRAQAPEPYTVTDATGSAPRTLTSPDGATVREVHDVPHDGASFFHALLAAAQVRGRLPHLLGTGLADRFTAAPADPAVTAEAVGAARDRLAWALGEDGNEDLLDALALDVADTFTQAELDTAGVLLTPAQQAEFDALGRLPETFWPTPDQRVALASAALSRPFASEPRQDGTRQPDGTPAPPERRAGDNGGADLLPALAARVLGTPLTVVTGEGRDQLFLPHGVDPAAVDPAADPVLFAADGFFAAALPPGTPAPVTTALSAPEITGTPGTGDPTTGQPTKPPAHRTHTTAPWLPPADGSGPRYRLARDGVLTASDGATYTQGAPTGRGNGFFGALSTALLDAARRPDVDRHEAARLRLHAGASPARLMRLNGLPGAPTERDALFSPPPLMPRGGAPAPTAEALEGHLRRHLAQAPWGHGADRAVAEWAAAATGTTVTLVEENGTAHTYPGPAGESGPHLRLRRRGGDFVPLVQRTPAPAPVTSKTPGTDTAPPAPERASSAPSVPRQDPAFVPLPPSPAEGGLPELPGEEEAYELDTLSGAEGTRGSGRPRPPQPEAEALAQFRFTDDIEAERLAQLRFTDADLIDSETDSENGDPDLTPEEYLDLLFGAATRGDYSPEMLIGTAMSLRELARKHTDATGETTGALGGLHGLTGRVLGLHPNTPVGDRHLLFLGSLALSAAPGQLADEDALSSYMRSHDAALGRESQLTQGNGAVRNWTGTGDQVPPLDTYAVEHENGWLSTWSAPWTNPYMVLAQEHGDAVRLNTPDGTITLDDSGEFARLVTRDPARRGKSDIVLAFPHGDIASLAQHVADLTGARVWYSEHAPRPSTDWRTGTDRITLGPVGDGVGTAWSFVRPDQDADSEGDVADIVDLYGNDSEPGDGIEARRAKPLTTTDYGVVDDDGEGVLFRRPGGIRGDWQTPRALTGTEDAPELLMNEQDYHQTLATERPALRISPDRTLAIEDGAYGQQVFATKAAVDAASAKLSRAGLAVRLRADKSLSVILPTPDGGSRRLFRVTPDFLTRSGRSTEEVCRDFADMLADNARTSHMVFRASGGGPAVTAPVNASDGIEVTGTHHLADALSHVADGDVSPESADPAWAASLVRRDDRPTGGYGDVLPGRAYGSALSLTEPVDLRRDALSDAARRIGVNEHAWADVGEAYVVQSIAETGDQGQPSLEHNYAKPQSGPNGAHFGYHFATVVLASEDGSHQISLENHARVSQRNHRHRRAVQANLRNHDLDELRETAAQLRQEIGRQEQADTDEHLAELRGYLDLTFALIRAKQAQTEMQAAPAGSPERAEAEKRLEAATRAAASRIGNLEPVIPGKHQWYMRMYSQRPGESAHDINAELLEDKPAAEANPLTAVVLRGQQALPVSVSFDKGDQQTPEGSRNAIRHLAKVVARTGLWNTANGLPLPDVTVSGQRNARIGGRDFSKARAEAVAASFRRELADALAALQEGTPGPHLTADRFTVDPVSVRGRRPSLIGGDAGSASVDITVEDHRGGPRHVATRGLRSNTQPGGGLRGGSRDDGLDPVAEQWPIGRPVTLVRPRLGGIAPGSVVPVTDVPAAAAPPTEAPATAEGKSPAAEDARRPERWFTYSRAAESRPEPFRYEVAGTGHIRLPDGLGIPPDGWTRFGHDFVHEDTGVLLRGDSGWIGRVDNMDTLSLLLADLDQDPVPQRITADSSALYVVPEHGATALRIPLQEPAQPPRAPRDDRPRAVVRSAFDVRRLAHGGENVTDLTVRLALRQGEDGQADTDAVMARVRQGVEEFYNRPGHRLPGGDRLHVTVEFVAPDDDPHLTVDLVDRDQPMNQRAWWADADPVEFAHELAHQLFLRDETRDASNPGRLDAPGSLLGPFREEAPDGLAQSGLRPRHLQVLAAVAGDVELHTPPEGTSWTEARSNAPTERREQAWVDPVSLPEPSRQTGPDGAVPPPLPPGRALSTLPEASDESENEPDSDSSDEGDEQPLWTDTGWLSTLFGPRWSGVPRDRLEETSEALFDLVEAEADGQTAPQALRGALSRVTRRVLHMGSGTQPGPADFQLLGSLALDASSDDLDSTDDLARYFVERQIETGRGALDEGTLLRDTAGNAAGRDFGRSGQPAPAPDSYVVRGRSRVLERPAPWRNPYMVVATVSGGAVEISLMPGRTFRVSDLDELAMIVSYDSRRPRGADIVLALPPKFAAPLAAAVAGTTGRRVWYPEAPTGVATHPTAGSRLLLDLTDGDHGEGWASVDPVDGDGLPGARDLGSDGDSAAGPDPDSDDEQSSSDGDAEFDRLADQFDAERRIEARRARPLTTREYGVIDKRGTGVLFTRPLPRTVGEVGTGDGTGPDALPLVLPRQDQSDVLMADRPPLHISEDRTLALLADGDGTTGRSQQVYATRAAIERSSARLAAAGAGVRLRADESTGVLLPKEDGSYGEPLFRVEPEFLTASGGPEHAFTRDFAQIVAGEGTAPLSHIAFRGPTGDAVATAPVNARHGREVTGTHHLAEALAEVAEGTRRAGDVSPRWAARQTGRDSRFTGGVVGAPSPGERYGSALSLEPADNPRRAPLAAAARRIGVNEYAWARVGEGYLIQSVSTTNDSGAQLFTHNHAKPGDRVGPHAPYHFAQVVLASEDGTHQITLENETHSRGEIPAAQLDDVIDDNLDRYGEEELGRFAREAEQRADEARRGGADGARADRLAGFARVARALAAVRAAERIPFYFDEDRPEHALAVREEELARSRAREAIRAAAPVMADEDLWFFRAYSKRPGESAHEVNAALLSESPPAVANPLTTVVLHGHTPRQYQRAIRFAEQQHALPDGADATIDALARTLARAGLWNRANGLPVPAVTVTGHGNRSLASGRKRAEAVGRALGARLAQFLAASQTGTSGTPLAVRDFKLTLDAKRVRSATDPDQGRVVTVEIDDRLQLVAGPAQGGVQLPDPQPQRGIPQIGAV
ncbi:lonely Cys domain-containing protein, partial [Streptomyces sp. NPDC004011]